MGMIIREHKLDTEEKIKAEWNMIHKKGCHYDGFPDTYEEFRDDVLAFNQDRKLKEVKYANNK